MSLCLMQSQNWFCYAVAKLSWSSNRLVIIPPANCVCGGGYTVFTLSVRPFCFLNIFKSHGWNFIKPCILIHICRANTYDKNVWARGHFYESYFPF